jgi:hypothetical protein
VQEAAELVAIDVYKRAEKTGERITLAVVKRRVAELLGMGQVWRDASWASCSGRRVRVSRRRG